MEDIGRSDVSILYKSDENSKSKLRLEWIIENKAIKGMRLEVKAESSSESKVSEVYLDSSLSENKLSLIKIETIRKGGLGLKTPINSYPKLNEVVNIGYKFKEESLLEQKPREFKTGGNIGIMVKTERIESNRVARESSDLFEIGVLYTNTSQKKICIQKLNVTWKLKGEVEWKDVTSIESMLSGVFSVDSLSTIGDFYKIYIEDKEKKEKEIRIFNRSWLARINPIRFKFEYEDVEGKKAFQIIEYVNKPPYIPRVYNSDLLCLYVDNPNTMSRDMIKVEEGDVVNGKLFKIDGEDFTEKSINKYVYLGLKEANYEYLVKSVKKDDYTYDVYFLIDSSCKRAYALKIILQNPFASSLGYFPIPLYSLSDDEKDKAETCLVNEKALLPHKEYALNDVVDYEEGETGIVIKTVEDNKKESEIVNNNNESNSDVISYLKSIDSKIERIASSLEKLVFILDKK
jgi:hypothetical protein